MDNETLEEFKEKTNRKLFEHDCLIHDRVSYCEYAELCETNQICILFSYMLKHKLTNEQKYDIPARLKWQINVIRFIYICFLISGICISIVCLSNEIILEQLNKFISVVCLFITMISAMFHVLALICCFW